MKKLSIAPKIVSRKGSGRIDDNIPVDFMEYAIPKPDEITETEEFHIVPDEIKVNKLIDKIEVFDRVRGVDGKKHVPIKIHFVGVGVIQFPDTEMLEKTKEEMKAYAKKAS